MNGRNTALPGLVAIVLASLLSTNQPIHAADSVPESAAANQGRHSVRDSVRKAIPYLERYGEAWIEKRQCVSCHQVPFMLWSLSEADKRGYPIDRHRLKKWRAWSIDIRSFVKPAQKEDLETASTLAANIDTINALLLGNPAKAEASTTREEVESAAWRKNFVNALLENQGEGGSWQPCGQLPAQKRPLQETTQVTTAWTMLALQRSHATTQRAQQALALLKNESPVSTEWWAVRLLLADQRGDADANTYFNGLLEKQQPDGGWGWLTADTSDALATGMAVYALSRHNHEKSQRAISKAVTFLTTTQTVNGSWKVPGTKKTTRQEPTPTSNYWGTAWAVIGLLESEQ